MKKIDLPHIEFYIQVEDPSSQLMKLKYFLILTSKREIYPTIGNDKNQGQFK